MHTTPTPPQLTWFATAEVHVGTPITIGMTPEGSRRVVPIRGGKVTGKSWTGTILDAGADFQRYPDPSIAILHADYVIESDSGEKVLVENLAVRVAEPDTLEKIMRGHEVSPDEVYFRCTPRLSADRDSSFNWVNGTLFVGTGIRKPDRVILEFFQID